MASRILRTFGLIFIVIGALLTVGPPGQAAEAFVLADVHLPTPRDGIASVWTGSVFYLIGGFGPQETGEILRFDPVTNALETMQAHLAVPRTQATAVWTGQFIYVLGGLANTDPVEEIERYDPTTDTITTISAVVPRIQGRNSGMWTGSVAVLFPLCNIFPNPSCQVIRFDPATETVSLGASMPQMTSWPSGVWMEGRALFFGFRNFAYDPVADALDPIRVHYPFNTLLVHPAAVTLGPHVYLFGGPGETDAFFRYTPALGALNQPPLQLPFGLERASAASDGERIWIFGGIGLDTILRFAPDPTWPVAAIAPTNAHECINDHSGVFLDGSASSDPDGDPLQFEWTAPGATLNEAAASSTDAEFPFGTTLTTLAVDDGETRMLAFEPVRVVDTEPILAFSLLRPQQGVVYVHDVESPTPIDATRAAVAVGPLTANVIALDRCGIEGVTFVETPLLGDWQTGPPLTTVDRERPFSHVINRAAHEEGSITLTVQAADRGGHVTDVQTVRLLKIGTGEPCEISLLTSLAPVPCVGDPI